MNNIFITIKKELRSILRDKKTLRLIFIYPIMIPILIILYANMYNSILNEETTTTIGINYKVNEIEKNILKENNIEYKEYKTTKEMQKAYDSNEISGYINYEEDIKNYQVYIDYESTDGSFTAQSIYVYLEEYSSYLTNMYLLENNINIEVNEEEFYKYMKNILEWNEKINVTNIKDEKEFIIKHFIDSLSILKYITNSSTHLDNACKALITAISSHLLLVVF